VALGAAQGAVAEVQITTTLEAEQVVAEPDYSAKAQTEQVESLVAKVAFLLAVVEALTEIPETPRQAYLFGLAAMEQLKAVEAAAQTTTAHSTTKAAQAVRVRCVLSGVPIELSQAQTQGIYSGTVYTN
jgi:DNA-directed RNA polymerase specialized sigma24 family protein